MPSTLASEAISSLPNNTQRKRWTRAEVSALESAGLLKDERLELIEGELILKMGKNHPHTIGIWLLVNYLVEVFSMKRVLQEAPIDVHPLDNPTSQPEPDLIVLNKPVLSLAAYPTPRDLSLVCEVSDSTLAFDLSRKAQLYARANIVEYWVLDLVNKRMIVYRSPTSVGFESIQVFSTTESIAPLAAPRALVPVATFFSEATS
jgi:Uma2 family endonuclease